MKKRVVLVTQHYLGSKRKAGFHWLAEAYHRAGWEVLFFTAAISWLSYLNRNYRTAYPIRQEANQIRWIQDALGSFVWFTQWHPANLRLGVLNRMATGLFRRYPNRSLGEAEPLIEQADLILFESTPGLLLFERFKALNSDARFVYRVSDHLPLLRNHPVVLKCEQHIAPSFDLISTPSTYIFDHFRHLSNAGCHTHGIQKDLFNHAYENPFETHWLQNVLFVGNDRLDFDFLRIASRAFPDWAFHVLGPIPRLPIANNIIAYGELAFEDTIPYVQHADIGLHTLAYAPGAESFTDSLKVIQYAYCGLPVVASMFLKTDRPRTFYYIPNNEDTVASALRAAHASPRGEEQDAGIYSWDELAMILAGSLEG